MTTARTKTRGCCANRNPNLVCLYPSHEGCQARSHGLASAGCEPETPPLLAATGAAKHSHDTGPSPVELSNNHLVSSQQSTKTPRRRCTGCAAVWCSCTACVVHCTDAPCLPNHCPKRPPTHCGGTAKPVCPPRLVCAALQPNPLVCSLSLKHTWLPPDTVAAQPGAFKNRLFPCFLFVFMPGHPHEQVSFCLHVSGIMTPYPHPQPEPTAGASLLGRVPIPSQECVHGPTKR